MMCLAAKLDIWVEFMSDALFPSLLSVSTDMAKIIVKITTTHVMQRINYFELLI